LKKRSMTKKAGSGRGRTINPDFAVDIVARRRKPKRNAQLEQFVAKS
jgi:hypothetical protein